MYPWLIFVHVLAVFGFLLAHGASITVAFRIRIERRPDRVSVLLELSQASAAIMNASLIVVLATGIAGGFFGAWWGRGWIWAALGVFLLLSLAMTFIGRRSFERVRAALRLLYAKLPSPSAQVGSEEALAEDLAASLRSVHPVLLTMIGGGGLAAILWLMMFKPF